MSGHGGPTRSGTVAVMNLIDDVRPALTGHPTPAEVSAEVIEVTGGGLRIAEVGLAAVVAAIAVPTVLVRHVLAHHRAHGSTLFLHRLRS
jgi:hypothetical protein